MIKKMIEREMFKPCFVGLHFPLPNSSRLVEAKIYITRQLEGVDIS
jgi:hypothetical protein